MEKHMDNITPIIGYDLEYTPQNVSLMSIPVGGSPKNNILAGIGGALIIPGSTKKLQTSIHASCFEILEEEFIENEVAAGVAVVVEVHSKSFPSFTARINLFLGRDLCADEGEICMSISKYDPNRAHDFSVPEKFLVISSAGESIRMGFGSRQTERNGHQYMAQGFEHITMAGYKRLRATDDLDDIGLTLGAAGQTFLMGVIQGAGEKLGQAIVTTLIPMLWERVKQLRTAGNQGVGTNLISGGAHLLGGIVAPVAKGVGVVAEKAAKTLGSLT